MPLDLLLALFGFALASACTPGPNNTMLLASGANFGFRRTLPHMAGVALGFPLMVLAMGLGLSAVFEALPTLAAILKAVSFAYLLYLAWKIATAAPPEEGAEKGRPLSFFQAAAFQWVNPKAWAIALSVVAAYGAQDVPMLLGIALIFAAAGCVSTTGWTVIGQQATRLLSSRRRLVIFNRIMALLMVASLVPAMLG
ncbi:LysE family translocator [Roseicyclus sp. F158]|uniref:LysE family translocator n=1 Tax=Tropicimonas omnivorans TaxID=3075590 RepID=A0ABU3DL40_9RHOB|nr:LysE family translocator [Roseicyclus sp. F158]MDT0684254.1 LysE family translocator [Roseicyclus sp. F158]